MSEYKIVGGTGQAGGLIFYDKGNDSDGWRYLEAAPVESEFLAEWGADDVDVSGTLLTIGSGKSNTDIIIAKLNLIGETGKAAQICRNLNINGFQDWFLPSKEELYMMFSFLAADALGCFECDWYSSSSQKDNELFHEFDFGEGVEGYGLKFGISRFRAIRAF